MRRLEIFHTSSLAEKDPHAPEWMHDNAFNILLWIVKEIRENRRYIDASEFFFTRDADDLVPRKVRKNYIWCGHLNIIYLHVLAINILN